MAAQAALHWSEPAGAVCQCQALQRETEKGDRDGWAQSAIPAGQPPLNRFVSRDRIKNRGDRGQQCVSLRHVEC